MEYSDEGNKPTHQYWIQLLNIVSAISTITGVTILSIKNSTALTLKDIFVYGISCLIGLTVFTIIIGYVMHILKNRWDNIRNGAKYGVQMVAVTCLVLAVFFYITYIFPYTVDLMYFLLKGIKG